MPRISESEIGLANMDWIKSIPDAQALDPNAVPVVLRNGKSTKGGPGSGDHGHAGRPGEVGGSLVGTHDDLHKRSEFINGSDHTHPGPFDDPQKLAVHLRVSHGYETPADITRNAPIWSIEGLTARLTAINGGITPDPDMVKSVRDHWLGHPSVSEATLVLLEAEREHAHLADVRNGALNITPLAGKINFFQDKLDPSTDMAAVKPEFRIEAERISSELMNSRLAPYVRAVGDQKLIVVRNFDALSGGSLTGHTGISQGTNAYYNPQWGFTAMFDNESLMSKDPLTDKPITNDTVASKNMYDVLTHEYGHQVMDVIAHKYDGGFESRFKAYHDVHKDAFAEISYYAKLRPSEGFAEAFAVMHRPDFDPSMYSKETQNVFKYVSSALKWVKDTKMTVLIAVPENPTEDQLDLLRQVDLTAVPDFLRKAIEAALSEGKGGPGSGGPHAGRPGQVGGSAPSGITPYAVGGVTQKPSNVSAAYSRAAEKLASLGYDFDTMRGNIMQHGKLGVMIAKDFRLPGKNRPGIFIGEKFVEPSAKQREQGRTWYTNANQLVKDWATKYNVPEEKVCAMLAATSNQTAWSSYDPPHPNTNQYIAEEAIRIWAHERDEGRIPMVKEALLEADGTPKTKNGEPVMGYALLHPYGVSDKTGEPTSPMAGGRGYQSMEKIIPFLEDMTGKITVDSVMGSGTKTRSFYMNIAYPNATDNPDQPVTIDRHAIGAVLGMPVPNFDELHGTNLKSALADPGFYDAVAQVYRSVADEAGIPPDQVQAIIWKQWEDQYGKDSGKFFIVEDSKYSPDQPRNHGQFASSGVTAAEVGVLVGMTPGSTYNVVGKSSPRTGKIVSPYPEHEKTVRAKNLTKAVLWQYAANNYDLLSQPNHFLGQWHEDGNVFLDVSVRAETHEEAIKLSSDHQRAYYDLDKGETVSNPNYKEKGNA